MGINDNSFSIVNPAQDEAPDGIPKYNDAKYPIELELLTAHTGCTENKHEMNFIPNKHELYLINSGISKRERERERERVVEIT